MPHLKLSTKLLSFVTPTRVILLTGLILIGITSNINWGKDRWKDIVKHDAQGYYAYLPAVFIYHDLNFHFFESAESQFFADSYFDYRKDISGVTINKYYCGTALMQLPFFVPVHLLFHGDGTSGWGKPYRIMISIAAIAWLLAGLAFFSLFLRLCMIPDTVNSLVLLITVFGTHLFYYTICEPGMSHVYSFALVAMFLFYGKLVFTRAVTPSRLIILSSVLALLILVRPVDGLIVLLLPFLSGNANLLYERIILILNKPVAWISASLIFIGIISIQLIIYRIASGNFFIYAYANEKFDFGNPHFFSMLFSFKKGLFVYTPLTALACAGFIPMWRQSRFAFVALLLFLIILNYILSSWWMWWYGGSFSSRVYVEFLPLFMMMMALSLQWLHNKRIRTLFITFALLLLAWNQVQTYQYRKGAIHWDSMTRQKYLESVSAVIHLIHK